MRKLRTTVTKKNSFWFFNSKPKNQRFYSTSNPNQKEHSVITEQQLGKPTDEHIYSIRNYDTILNEIDKTIGVSKPPALELLYVEPTVTKLQSFRATASNSSYNPYGHSVMRYSIEKKMDDDSIGHEEHMMNIVGNAFKTGANMVNFMHPKEYLFGDPTIYEARGAEQGGVHYRSIVGIRVENWPREHITTMYEYYQHVSEREREGKAKYSMLLGTMSGWNLVFAKHFNHLFAERGNCSYWTTKGLVQAQMLKKATMWPKYGLIKLYLQMLLLGKKGDVNIVSYRQKKYKHEKEVRYPLIRGWTKPFSFMEHDLFFDLDSMANVVVELEHEESGDSSGGSVANQQFVAKVSTQDCEKRRPFWNIPDLDIVQKYWFRD